VIVSEDVQELPLDARDESLSFVETRDGKMCYKIQEGVSAEGAI